MSTTFQARESTEHQDPPFIRIVDDGKLSLSPNGRRHRDEYLDDLASIVKAFTGSSCLFKVLKMSLQDLRSSGLVQLRLRPCSLADSSSSEPKLLRQYSAQPSEPRFRSVALQRRLRGSVLNFAPSCFLSFGSHEKAIFGHRCQRESPGFASRL